MARNANKGTRVRRRAAGATWVALGGLLGGCVERTLTVESDPPGALVYLNDQEVGRTPMTRDFLWYGDYEVELRKEGYEPVKTHKWLVAPLKEWAPFDLATELMPFHFSDHKKIKYTLRPTTGEIEAPENVVGRGEEMRGRLRSSALTRQPATRAATTEPASRPKRPATQLSGPQPTTAP